MDQDESVVVDGAAEGSTEELETTTPEEVLAITGHEAPEVEGEEEEQEAKEPEGDEEEEPADPVEGEEEAEPTGPVVDDPAAEEPAGDAPTFAVEVVDANGNTVTINPGDNLEEVLADFEPKNNGQIFQVIKDVMAAEQAKDAHDKEQTEAAEQAEYQAQITTIQEGWDKEIAELQGSKRIAGGDEGKERTSAVFEFMREENTKRIEAGKPTIQTFEDALDKLELKEQRDAAADKKKTDKEAARKRGGMVGGSSAPASKGGPVYRGGARNANEAMREMGLL